jgi:hypothetical protein
MSQPAHSIDQEMSLPCPASAQDASMDVEAVAKFGYRHLEAVKYFTLDPSGK